MPNYSSFFTLVQLVVGVVAILGFIGTLWKIVRTVVNSEKTLADVPAIQLSVKSLEKEVQQLTAAIRECERTYKEYNPYIVKIVELDRKLEVTMNNLNWIRETVTNIADLRTHLRAINAQNRDERR